jgi:prevent-host-death family protein
MAKIPEIVPVSDLRQGAAAVLERLRKSRQPLVITQRGRAAAVLVPIAEYERSERELELLRDLALGEKESEKGGRDLVEFVAEGGALREQTWGREARPAEQLRARREEILEIAGRHGARNVRVFGSVARGDAGPGSDVDLLVDLEPGRSLFDLGGLQVELQALLGCGVDVVTPEGLRERIRERVLREAVPV